jgi:hypothetical protein
MFILIVGAMSGEVVGADFLGWRMGAPLYAQAVGAPQLLLPLVSNGPPPLAARIGYNATMTPITRYPAINILNAGWYADWAVRRAPARPSGIEYVQVIRLHQELACGLRYHSDRVACPYRQPLAYTYWPNAAAIRAAAQENPGSLWLIGNEMDRRDWAYCIRWQGNFCQEVGYNGQDEMLPESYAVAYHELSAIVREADPTAKISIGGVIQATPLRLAYLTTVWDTHLALYGEPMQVDVWNVHNFILQEQRNNWGADVPPGAASDEGEYIGSTLLHLDLTLFDHQIRAFRQWMKERGQQEKPLIVSEYGVLFRNDTMGFPNQDPSVVHQFMSATFDYFLNTRDCSLGYLADDCRLVQRWNWFSLDDSGESFNPHSRLFDPITLEMTSTGDLFRTFVAENLARLEARGYD